MNNSVLIHLKNRESPILLDLVEILAIIRLPTALESQWKRHKIRFLCTFYEKNRSAFAPESLSNVAVMTCIRVMVTSYFQERFEIQKHLFFCFSQRTCFVLYLILCLFFILIWSVWCARTNHGGCLLRRDESLRPCGRIWLHRCNLMPCAIYMWYVLSCFI